jgi:hypothetical protein
MTGLWPVFFLIAAQGTGQRESKDKVLGEWGTRARSTSAPIRGLM